MEIELLTIPEFAVRIGKSERQVRRYTEQGKITTIETTAGPRISSSDLLGWRLITPTPLTDLGTAAEPTPASVQYQEPAYADTSSPNAGVISSALSDAGALRIALEHTTRLLDQVEALRIALDAERDEKHREQRLADQLRSEIGSYQRALSETAESLAEQRAQVEAQRRVELQRQAEVAIQVERIVELEKLRLDATTTSRGWGSRLRRIFGARQTG